MLLKGGCRLRVWAPADTRTSDQHLL